MELFLKKESKNNVVIVIALLFIINITNFGYIVYFFMLHGYLPVPFYIDKYDTFMDLFNTLYWSTNDGRYTIWSSIYPPLVFVVLAGFKRIFFGFEEFNDSFSLRNSGDLLILIFIFSAILSACLVFTGYQYKKFASLHRLGFFLIFILSSPFLFCLERGNVALFCLPLLGMAFVANGWKNSLSIAILVNIKPYFVMLFIGYFLKNTFLKTYQLFLITFILFVFSGMLIDNNFLYFFNSLVDYSSNKFLNDPDGVLAFPSSITAFSYVSDWVDFFTKSEYSLINLEILRLNSIIFRYTNLFLIVCLILFLLLNRKNLSFSECSALIIVIICNFSFSFGGYTIIYYVVSMPYLRHFKSFPLIIGLLSVMFLPIDCFIINPGLETTGKSWYLDDIFIMNREQGLGSFLRPSLNMLIMIILTQELWQRGRSYINLSKIVGFSKAIKSSA